MPNKSLNKLKKSILVQFFNSWFIIMDFQTITKNFTDELNKSAAGKATSLLFTVNELPHHPLVRTGEPFQVIKIGGSILQNAMVRNVKKQILIDSFEEERLPIFTTKKAFLAFVKSHLRKNTKFLAINFAYPVKPILANGLLDGILLTGTKEHTFTGLIGQKIGKSIEDFIKGKFNRNIKVALANDTVCLLLSGLVDTSPHNLAGGVVGTGLNFAYFIDNKQLVNLESHNFNKFELSPEAKIIDKLSKNSGRSLFEKEVAGNWLHMHYNLRRKNQYESIESTHELDKIARGKKAGDKQLAQNLFERAAQLVACQIAGITNYKKINMNFVMEGSLFWVGWHYRQMVESYLKKLTNYRITFTEIKDCGIIGAAKLVV